jgi:hypothetical protein
MLKIRIFRSVLLHSLSEVHQLVNVLDQPHLIKCSQSNIEEDRVTALCMLLRRLAYPTRLVDVEIQLGWERFRFSRITRHVALAMFDRWKHLLRFDPTHLTPKKLAQFGAAIAAKGAPLDVVVALIDGTLQKNARPSNNQRLIYNGWKCIHCLKYHALISPDGIVIHVYGPVDGRRHDETVYKESGLASLLDAHFWTPDGQPLYIYGDPAYNVGPHILSLYRGPAFTREQCAFNTKMSRVHELVEWLFKEVSQQFTYLDFSRSQKILLSPCGLFYLISILLCNAHTILHYPQIPQYFACPPPTLMEYFTGGPVDDADPDKWCLDTMWHEVDIPEGDDVIEDHGLEGMD